MRAAGAILACLALAALIGLALALAGLRAVEGADGE